MRVTFFLAITIAGCSCTSAVETDATQSSAATDERTEQTFLIESEADRSACELEGGFTDRRGLIHTDICVHPFADAGKECSDSDECLGQCISERPEVKVGDRAKGFCQKDDALFGCYAEIRDGVALQPICVD